MTARRANPTRTCPIERTGNDGGPARSIHCLSPLRAKGLHGIKELSDLIIIGTVAQAEGGTLVVNATGIYVVK